MPPAAPRNDENVAQVANLRHIFGGITHVPAHTTENENDEAQVGNLRYTCFRRRLDLNDPPTLSSASRFHTSPGGGWT
jgi:hypothetical protein